MPHVLRYMLTALIVPVVIITCLVFGSDALVRFTSENLADYSLWQQSKDHLDDVESRVLQLRGQVNRLQAEINQTDAVTCPSPQDIRRLAQQERLSVRRLEQINRGRADVVGKKRWYRFQIVGSIGAITRFLREVESDYSFTVEYARVQPAEPSGKTVALSTLAILEN